MKLENQVCTFKQAKKLNELGVVQGCSTFYFDDTISNISPLFNKFHNGTHVYYNAMSCFSAFSVAELGQMLGRGIAIHQLTEGRNEAIDRADDLIHLLEIGELLVDSCNERLKNG